jgi:hypothetical protein
MRVKNRISAFYTHIKVGEPARKRSFFLRPSADHCCLILSCTRALALMRVLRSSASRVSSWIAALARFLRPSSAIFRLSSMVWLSDEFACFTASISNAPRSISRRASRLTCLRFSCQTRIHLPGGFYRIILRGNGGQNLFFSGADRYRFYCSCRKTPAGQWLEFFTAAVP